MLRVASPAALPSPRDAAAPYRMKTRLATQTARAGNAGAQLPHRPSVYRELSDSEDVSDAPSTPPRRKRKARTPAVKHRPSARPALPPPAAAPRPDPAAAPATWVEDEVSQWHGRIFVRSRSRCRAWAADSPRLDSGSARQLQREAAPLPARAPRLAVARRVVLRRRGGARARARATRPRSAGRTYVMRALRTLTNRRSSDTATICCTRARRSRACPTSARGAHFRAAPVS